MPTTLARACPHYGCQHPAQDCPTHSRKAQAKAYDDRRGSRHERGYTNQWVRFTEQYRNELAALGIPPVCGARHPSAPLTTDSDCAQAGRYVTARVVDHITPVQGKDDPRFFDRSNLQLLCDGATGHGCHDRKRQRERHQ